MNITEPRMSTNGHECRGCRSGFGPTAVLPDRRAADPSRVTGALDLCPWVFVRVHSSLSRCMDGTGRMASGSDLGSTPDVAARYGHAMATRPSFVFVRVHSWLSQSSGRSPWVVMGTRS